MISEIITKGRLIQKIHLYYVSERRQRFSRIFSYPCNFFREDATKEGSGNSAYSVHTANHTKPLASETKWDQIANDQLRQDDNAAPSNPLNRPTGQKDCEVVRHTAYEDADQEQD